MSHGEKECYRLQFLPLLAAPCDNTFEESTTTLVTAIPNSEGFNFVDGFLNPRELDVRDDIPAMGGSREDQEGSKAQGSRDR